jgi:hypothetical protein
MTPEKYLESVMPTREEVDAFVERGQGPDRVSRNGGFNYDPELGWIHTHAVREDGVDASKTFLSYESDQARHVIHYADRQCRIHTFGDSFTHCDQVNDGETWQEYLAGHLQEPVRNYGVGGYSVYQAYLRMKRVEATRSAQHIILNIYDHDHHRNLFRWWAINFGQRVECGFTSPHLKINVAEDRVEEMPNLLNRAEDVYKLCDPDWVIETFRNDPILPIAFTRRHPEWATRNTVEQVASGFGLTSEQVADASPLEAIEKLALAAALFATRHVVLKVEEFVRGTGKKLFVILSHCAPYTANVLAGKPRWDQGFLNFIRGRGYPVIDMRDAFAVEYAMCKVDPSDYLRKYYNSHHSPAGNYFMAWAIKDEIVKWLDPKPLPYGPRGEDIRVQHDGWKPAQTAPR